MKNTILTLGISALVSTVSQGATMAQYLHTATTSSKVATSVAAGVTASNFVSVGNDDGDYRTTFGSADYPGTNVWKTNNHNQGASADIGAAGPVTTSYLGFSLAATNVGEAIDLDTLSFEWGIANSLASTQSSDANYRLFASTNGGATFVNMGTDTFTDSSIAPSAAVIAPTASIDLTSLGAQTAVEFRLFLWDVGGSPSIAKHPVRF